MSRDRRNDRDDVYADYDSDKDLEPQQSSSGISPGSELLVATTVWLPKHRRRRTQVIGGCDDILERLADGIARLMGDRTWKVTTIEAEIDDDLVIWKGTVEFLDGERAQIAEDYDEDVADEITDRFDELATRLHELGKEQWTRAVYSLRTTGEASLELQHDGHDS